MRNRIFMLLLLPLLTCCRTPELIIKNPGFGGTHGDKEAERVQEVMATSVHLTVDRLFVPAENDHPCAPSDNTCTPPIPKDRSGHGSGVVVHYNSDTDTSYILTAGHVCGVNFTAGQDGEYFEEKGRTVFLKIKITNAWKKTFEGKIANYQVSPDLCLVRVDDLVGNPAKVYEGEIPVGADALTVGYPGGRNSNVGVFAVRGTKFGKAWRLQESDKSAADLYSFPVIPGQSGSGIFYKGKLSGVISAANTNFHHISFSVPLDKIREFLETIP